MRVSSLRASWVGLLVLFLGIPPSLLPADTPSKPDLSVLSRGQESLQYSIDWRVFNAGSAKLTLTPEFKDGKPAWKSNLKLESSGVIAALYRVADEYNVNLEDDFCALSSVFSAQEGKRNRETRVSYDRARGRAAYVERDRVKNAILKAGQTDIPPCASDVIGGLYRLRTMKLVPGHPLRLPVSNGKKSAEVRIEPQAREEVVTKAGKFNTVRCEVFLFNGVLYSRHATLDIWMTDDERHLPVQLRVRLPVLIGTITFQLDKEERS